MLTFIFNNNDYRISDESTFKPETVVHLEVVTTAAISPDGEKVAYIRRTQRAPEDVRGAAYTEMFLSRPGAERHSNLLSGRITWPICNGHRMDTTYIFALIDPKYTGACRYTVYRSKAAKPS